MPPLTLCFSALIRAFFSLDKKPWGEKLNFTELDDVNIVLIKGTKANNSGASAVIAIHDEKFPVKISIRIVNTS